MKNSKREQQLQVKQVSSLKVLYCLYILHILDLRNQYYNGLIIMFEWPYILYNQFLKISVDLFCNN